MSTKNKHRKQHGSTLLIALVMLVVLTLLAVSAILTSSTNLRIAGNMQAQEETVAAAQLATEQVLSANFTTSPVSQVVNVDINQDGAPDYTVNLAAPVCTGSTPVLNAYLDPSNSSDASCLASGAATNTGIMTASGVVATGQSWCYRQNWEIQASVTDSRTGAVAVTYQGVDVRVPAGTGCP